MLEELRGRKPSLIDMGSYRRSAVVIPLIKTESGYEVLFEVRAIGLKHQPGEICFPGGGCNRDEAAEAAARREICEELLLSPEQIRLEAPMDIFISPFNMIIYPYLGTLRGYQGTFSRDEVLEVFTVPLRFFMENEPRIYYNNVYTEPPENFPWDKVQDGYKYRWNTGKYPVAFYEYENRVIWGITARIMRSTVQIMRDAGWGIEEK